MDNTPWDAQPPQGSVKFFVERMEEHAKVTRLETLSPNRHDLTLFDGTEVRVFITPAYTFSESDYANLRARHPEVNCILSDASWHRFSTKAEQAASADGVATFHIGELMGAVWRGADFVTYQSSNG